MSITTRHLRLRRVTPSDRVKRVVRRSVALPGALLEQVAAVAPPELQGNFNRLVRVALEEFLARREAASFELAMACMARDSAMERASSEITLDFMAAEEDGLPSS